MDLNQLVNPNLLSNEDINSFCSFIAILINLMTLSKIIITFINTDICCIIFPRYCSNVLQENELTIALFWPLPPETVRNYVTMFVGMTNHSDMEDSFEYWLFELLCIPLMKGSFFVSKYLYDFFEEMDHPWPHFHLFSVFLNKNTFFNKSMWKIIHLVYGAGIRSHNLFNVRLHP